VIRVPSRALEVSLARLLERDDSTAKRAGIRNEFFLEKAKINAMFTDAQLLLLLFLCSRKCM
jgi:hypothetical protein